MLLQSLVQRVFYKYVDKKHIFFSREGKFFRTKRHVLICQYFAEAATLQRVEWAHMPLK